MYLFALFILSISLFLFLKNQKNKKNLDFPEPPKQFIFGHALQIKSTKSALNVFMKYINDYGPIVKLQAVFLKGLLTTDYKLSEFLLTSNKLLTKSQNYEYARPWLGDGLLLSDGDYWRRHRKFLTPTFHFGIIKDFVEVFERVSSVFLEKLGEQQSCSVDLKPLVTLCTLDIISETAMGLKINALSGENSEYVHSVKEMCRIIIDRCLSPLKLFDLTYPFTFDYYIQNKVIKILHRFTQRVISEKKTNPEAKSTKRKAFLDYLLDLCNGQKLLSDREIREEVDTFMFEGHDTTSSAICFALFCLAQHSTVQEKVVQEQKDIFGDDKNPLVTYDKLQEMKYLERVIKETLRLYPSVPVIGRYINEDTEYDGRVIPKGTNIAILIYGIHRNPEYFPEPEKFNPDRFENLALPPYAYIPFSAGPRNCIGQKFAMLEMKSIISKVIRHYVLKPASPQHNLILSLETVLKSANGFRVGLERRAK